MKIEESKENYLKTILLLEEQGTVRSVDVARKLGFTKPSVSRAVHLLQDQGLLVIAENGSIVLTEQGRQKATKIVAKHHTITQFLRDCLGVDDILAEEEACRIEHVISDETFEAMKRRLATSCCFARFHHKSV